MPKPAAPKAQFTLTERAWAAWQMVPGYGGDRYAPYYSPIYVYSVEPLRKGNGYLRLQFYNALYAEGVRDFDLTLRVLKRDANYLFAELCYGNDSNERAVLVSAIDFDWLALHCPNLLSSRPVSSFGSAAQASVSNYLTAALYDHSR